MHGELRLKIQYIHVNKFSGFHGNSYSNDGHSLGFALYSVFCFPDVSEEPTASIFRATELFKVNATVIGQIP
jgi:hypothetical protein